MKNEEYNSLRNEILTRIQISSNYYLSSIVTTGVIYGFAFNKEIGFLPYIFLIPPLILIPTMLNLAFLSDSVIRIRTYIQVFYNEKEKVEGWESRFHKLTKNAHWPIKIRRAIYSSSPFVLCLLSLFFFYITLSKGHWYDYLLIILITLSSIGSFYRMSNDEKKEVKNLIQWREILSEE